MVLQIDRTVLTEAEVLASLGLPEIVFVTHITFPVTQQGLLLTGRLTHAIVSAFVSFAARTMT